MQTSDAQRVIREGWSNPERVQGWVDGQLFREYEDPDVACAWRDALDEATGFRGGQADMSALDIGTGPGTIARFWCELGYCTTGLDVSPAMLEAAEDIAKKKGLDINYIEGDAHRPDFAPSSFDVISSRFLIFTLTNPGYAMREWLKLLKPGGYIVMIGHDHPDKPENRGHFKQPGKRRWTLSEEYREALATLPFKNHTSAELRVVMEALGLQDIRCVNVEKIVEARAKLGERAPELGAFSSVPFVLTGRYEPDAII